jgi:hypothetical protein
MQKCISLGAGGEAASGVYAPYLHFSSTSLSYD